jgi:lipopolysaccharide exporter
MSAAEPRSIGRKVADGAKQMLMLRLAERLVGLASISILAHVLMPEDFGLLALATSIIGVVELFGQAGIDLALIQRHKAGRDEYDTAWTVNIMIGAAIAALVAASAAPLAGLMGEGRIDVILYWLASASLVGGFNNIGTVDFQKFFDFRKEFWFRLTIRLITTAVTIVLALLWRDYWALVAGYLTGKVVLVALSYAMHPYRPRFSVRALRGFAHFSGWMLVRNVLNGINDHLINLIVGRQVSVGPLAYFTTGREIAGMATTEIQAPIRRALFPGYAALSGDPEALRRNYLEWTAVMVLLALPIAAGLALVAPDIVLVLMGAKWLPAAPLIQILAYAGILRSFASGAQFLFIAVGRPEISAKLAGLRFALLIPLVVLGTSVAGAPGAAWAMLVTAVVMFNVNFRFVTRALGVAPTALFRVAHRPVIAVLAMMVVVWVLDASLLPGPEAIVAPIHLITATVTGAAVYVGTLAALWTLAGRPSGAERHALDALASLRV